MNGKTYVPGQANNVYVFPGIGLGVIASEASRVTDEMFSVAAKTLAEQVSESDLAQMRIFPPLSQIREVSARIALAVAEVAYKRGLAQYPRPVDLLGYIESQMYVPNYEDYD